MSAAEESVRRSVDSAIESVEKLRDELLKLKLASNGDLKGSWELVTLLEIAAKMESNIKTNAHGLLVLMLSMAFEEVPS